MNYTSLEKALITFKYIQNLNQFSPNKADQLQQSHYMKNFDKYQLEQTKANEQGKYGKNQISYIGQISNSLPCGFGIACNQFAHLEQVLKNNYSQTDAALCTVEFIIGFWEKGYLKGLGMQMQIIPKSNIQIEEAKIGLFDKGILNGFGLELKRQIMSKCKGVLKEQHIIQAVKQVNNQADIIKYYKLIGCFSTGKLNGMCAIQQNDDIIKGIMSGHKICGGEMAKNSGTGQGFVKFMQMSAPYNVILSQEGTFASYILHGKGKYVSPYGVAFSAVSQKDVKQLNYLQFQNNVDFTFEGEFENGLPRGNGKLILGQNEVHEGQFHMQAISNKNYLIQILGNIDQISGSGEGEMITFDLRQCRKINIRQGTFSNYLQQGIGSLKIGTVKYEGNFKDHWPSGKGKIVDRCVQKTEGQFKTMIEQDPVIICVQGDISIDTGDGIGKMYSFSFNTLNLFSMVKGEFRNFKFVKNAKTKHKQLSAEDEKSPQRGDITYSNDEKDSTNPSNFLNNSQRINQEQQTKNSKLRIYQNGQNKLTLTKNRVHYILLSAQIRRKKWIVWAQIVLLLVAVLILW